MMFFDSFNTSASFQDYINKIIAKKLDIIIVIYLNKILVNTGNTGQSYIETIC